MSVSKFTMIAAGLALGLSTLSMTTTQSFAQAGTARDFQLSDMREADAVMFMNSGKVAMSKTKMTEAQHTKAMSMGAHELSHGAMVYRHNGKLYLIEDKAGVKESMLMETFQDMFTLN